MLANMCSAQYSPVLLVEEQDLTRKLRNVLLNYAHTQALSQPFHLHVTNRSGNRCPQKNLPEKTHSSCIHKGLVISRTLDKPTGTLVEGNSLQQSTTPSDAGTKTNLKCMMLRQGSRVEVATLCRISFLWNSRRGQTSPRWKAIWLGDARRGAELSRNLLAYCVFSAWMKDWSAQAYAIFWTWLVVYLIFVNFIIWNLFQKEKIRQQRDTDL